MFALFPREHAVAALFWLANISGGTRVSSGTRTAIAGISQYPNMIPEAC
jgi:hypothetical protein